ncbi:3-dehydroquinate synthase [Gallaecimonas pentaromativorans]|uniref:3-dehydroquinate synthase n=1 Tax=Gallaecimonas pentaromativorans TaxID=584787 RepID=A0A3N1NWP4_9GAMM|nr:3-dehydroquinate synthase [Gallaecimonas pentaromativorans]ROQ23302.1 3-dehydroquinate synthase [Gallaecimonas pentaromativorans]
MKRLDVGLGERSYSILIGLGLHPSLKDQVQGRSVVVVSQAPLAGHLQTLKSFLGDAPKSLTCFELPNGEGAKNLGELERLIGCLIEAGLGRDGMLIALGGGVVGDITGFAAACYQRGMDFIQLPTTLLSQVDSAVGGKTAVNHPLGKNLIGAFHQPQAVHVDLHWLDTLPDNEMSAGLAEVIKYGVIADADFFQWLEANMAGLRAKDKTLLSHAIATSLAIKADIVAQDEREQGVRAHLNLGHTFGHAIEANQGYGNWLHGEAVGAGMLMAAELAKSRGMLDDEQLMRLYRLNKAAGLPLKGPAQMTPEQYLPLMMRDKKVLAGKLRLVLPKGLGQAVVVSDATEAEILAAIAAVQTANH